MVIHYTGMASAAEAADRLCDPAAEVSAHYLIAEDGHVLRLVPEDLRAWHAGAGRWGAVTDINSRSIGIELHNRGDRPFPAAQMRALAAVLKGIRARWPIGPERVIGHSDMAPLRKRDPGPLFAWRWLARQGLSVWPAAGAASRIDGRPSMAGFRAAARVFGYDPGLPDAVLLGAFRLRFRAGASGPLAPADLGMIADLARRWPVDRGPAED